MNMQSRTARLVFLALAIIGLISILGLAIWGTVRLATSLNNANPFSRLAVFIASVTLKKEIIRQDLVINASPSMVETGQEVALSWQSNINVGMLGAYVLTYPCNTGVTLKLPSNDTISCDAAFNLWSKTEITLIPTLTVENPVDLAITIAFVPQGATASTMNRTIAVTVTPLEKPATTDKPKTSATNPTTLTPGAETRSTYSINGNITPGTGAADLAISIVDTGIINDATNVFTHATSVASSNQRTGIIFDVINLGGVASQQWSFAASLPVAGGEFKADIQDPIPASTKVRYTMGFRDLASQGTNTIIIRLDPNNQISDSNRANNTASTTIYRAY